MLLLSCRNASGSLGEQEMLWELKPTGFHSLFDFSQTSSRIQLVYCDHQTVDSLCLPLIMFPLSHRGGGGGYFLMTIVLWLAKVV